MLKKLKKCARIAQSAKNAPALRQMPKNAAHAEKPKKCGIFVRLTIAFFPRVYYLFIYPFIYSFNRSVVYSFIHSFVRSFIYSFILFIYLFIHVRVCVSCCLRSVNACACDIRFLRVC